MSAEHAPSPGDRFDGWREKGNVDPSAGVTLWPRLLYCPRCGGVKGRANYDRPGLCPDCRSGMTLEQRIAWRS